MRNEGRKNEKRRRITERVQFKFVLSFALLVAGLLVLLNTYPIATSRDLVSVSYTHLDVYKRQRPYSPRPAPPLRRLC